MQLSRNPEISQKCPKHDVAVFLYYYENKVFLPQIKFFNFYPVRCILFSTNQAIYALMDIYIRIRLP